MEKLEINICNDNVQAYKYIHVIENGLREFIIEKMMIKYGAKWYKSHLTQQALDNYKKGIIYERSIKWNDLMPHHPLYYIDFTNIKEIIEKNDNWNGVFKEVFQRKDIICTSLSEIEYIRNKVAHNRKISENELLSLHSVYLKIESYIGEGNLKRLSLRCTSINNIKDSLLELRSNMKYLYQICIQCKTITIMNSWTNNLCGWWFDESYLNNKINNIMEFYNIIYQYEQITRSRGDGYKIEKWIACNNLIQIYNNAEEEFYKILEGSENDEI